MAQTDVSRSHEIQLLETIASGGGGTAGAAAPTTAAVSGGVYNSTPPALDDGDLGQTQMDVNGSTKTVEQYRPFAERNTDTGYYVIREGDFTSTRVTADGQIRSTAGFIQDIVIAPTGAITAGVVTFYDSLTEAGTILLSVYVAVASAPITIPWRAPTSTGLYVGFDATLAGVNVVVKHAGI